MRPSSARVPLLLALSVLAATPALAQRRGDYVECFRDGRRVSCDDVRDERDRAERRAREARQRAQEARERALDQARAARERAYERARIDRARIDRERIDRERIDRERRRWRDDSRTTIGLGAGADIRRFADVNRYFANASVDFHSRSGIGLRPEVLYGWSDRQTLSFAQPGTTTPLAVRARSQLLGVNVAGTYQLMRGSMVRPYLLAGAGVLSTRETRPAVTTLTQGTAIATETKASDHVDLGLFAGSGLEFGRGPVRVFAEFRYMLNDTPSTQGFSGALPITAGLRF